MSFKEQSSASSVVLANATYNKTEKVFEENNSSDSKNIDKECSGICGSDAKFKDHVQNSFLTTISESNNKCGLAELSLNSDSTPSPSLESSPTSSVSSQDYQDSAPNSPKTELSLFAPPVAFPPHFPSTFGVQTHSLPIQHPSSNSHTPFYSRSQLFPIIPSALGMMEGDPLNRPLGHGSSADFCCEWTTAPTYSSPMREMEGKQVFILRRQLTILFCHTFPH